MAESLKSRRQDQAKTDILTIALRMWRDPEADPFTLMHIGDYAADMRFMIHVASADEAVLAEAVNLTGATAQELVAAAVHYIEHYCQQMPVNPNRLLGLAPDAKQETAKLHYRMLIKLFHPDRALIPQARAEVCAAAINQAYAQFREDKAERSATELMAHAGRMEFPEVPSSIAKPAPEYFYSAPALQPKHSAGAIFQKIPLQFYLWGFAAIALVGLLVMNLNSAPVELAASGDVSSAKNTDNALTANDKVVNMASEPNSGFEDPVSVTASDDNQTEQLPAQSPVSNQMPPIAAADRVASASSRVQDVQPKSTKTSVAHGLATPKVPALPAIPAAGSVSSSPMVSASLAHTGVERPTGASIKDNPPPALVAVPEADVAPVAESISQSEPARIDEVVAKLDSKPAAELSDQRLRELTLQFMDSYNQGDVNRFAGLMHTELKGTEGSTQAEVRESYSKLFAKSDQREIVLKDLRWEIHGNTAVGLMDYKATLKLRSSRDPVISSGVLKLEVRMVNQSPKISAFFNMPNKR